MTDKSLVVVGLMSGTSLDGISAAVVRFTDRDLNGVDIGWELLAYDVTAYADSERALLSECLTGASPDANCRANYELGAWLARAATAVIAQAGIPRGEIAAIASHGQTLWHVPAHSSWQIGHPAVIAERTGIRVVSDFRARDIAAGGQGAPLVPIADALLFCAIDRWRVLQNLGGIGNLTVVPPSAAAAGVGGATVRAFDTGPGVVVIDGATQRLTNGRERFDRDGVLAAQGRPIDAAVDASLTHAYYSADPPKSTGRELYTPRFIDAFLADCRRLSPNATPADIVASAVALTARSIALAFQRFIPERVDELVLSGGGAKNPTLAAAIERAVAPVRVLRFDDVFFDGEAKEAVAFALLGYLHLRGRPGNVPSATGARGPRILGSLTPA
ncbi:MAG: anhydro-N-acetylmuramic acid kinase [Gemmatimonadaceae bacterium]